MRSTRSIVLLGVSLSVLTFAGPAAAHEGGKAEPRIAAGASGNAGSVRLLTVRLTDIDSGEAVSGATVRAIAEMTNPHLMRASPWTFEERAQGLYQAKVRFPMAAEWNVEIDVGGAKVVTATARFPVRVERSATTLPLGGSELATLPTRLADDLTQRDFLTMAALWVHGLAALGWIVGVLVMVLALSSRPGVLAEGMRVRLRGAYRDWGAWLHWGLVPAIVFTGIYNMLFVTPFPLAWRPADVRRLADVPYGPIYEAILVVKLGLFVALLITGTQLLARTVAGGEGHPESSANPHSPGFLRTLGGALGPAGILYLVCVPLILAAAMALRYVHVLSHVADVVQRS